MQDLQNFARSEQLRQEAIHLGFLGNSVADHQNFFGAIAHSIRTATRNTCGMLRAIIEQGLWHFLTQVDEDNGIRRLRQHTDTSSSTNAILEEVLVGGNDTDETDDNQVELSEDARIVEILTADLERVGVEVGSIFSTVKGHGYLLDWSKKRWERAELELVQRRLLQRRQVIQCSTS